MTAPDPRAWGVETGYWDFAGRWHEVPAGTVEAVLAAMGATSEAPPSEAPMAVVSEHGPWDLPEGTLFLESGGSIDLGPRGSRPGSLPVGYHRFQAAGESREVTVAVCPDRCPGAPPGHSWGWSAQLYAARSQASWGIGDLADLRSIAEWAADCGATFVLVNPLHAPAVGPVPEPSPYFPSSRCFLNPLYIRVEDVEGAAEAELVARLAEKGRALNSQRLIDRAAVWALKSEALEALFARFDAAGGDARFDEFVVGKGKLLDLYTSFCALSELLGLPWQGWPSQYRQPWAPGVATYASSSQGTARKRFYAWLQWVAEDQLAAAAGVPGVGIMCDLAVGSDGGGADAWCWQDTVALGMRVGAPPDEYNTKGQDWGLPPWDPWKLRSASYEPYVQMLRAVLSSASALRVDHVMGLFRLFWVPVGSEPSNGTYVRSLWQDMVGLLRLEASRAGAYVVGEDLGTVEEQVREVLDSSGVLSYKLLWFEDARPPEWAEQAMGAVTTHDLPTVAGVWTGSDVDAQRRIGLPLNEKSCAALRRRTADWTGSADDRPLAEVIEATYASLASAPCSLLAVVLDDVAGVPERPNMPATVAEWPNWRLALPMSLEELKSSDLAKAIARVMRRR